MAIMGEQTSNVAGSDTKQRLCTTNIITATSIVSFVIININTSSY
jgi:hypothetical protein